MINCWTALQEWCRYIQIGPGCFSLKTLITQFVSNTPPCGKYQIYGIHTEWELSVIAKSPNNPYRTHTGHAQRKSHASRNKNSPWRAPIRAARQYNSSGETLMRESLCMRVLSLATELLNRTIPYFHYSPRDKACLKQPGCCHFNCLSSGCLLSYKWRSVSAEDISFLWVTCPSAFSCTCMISRRIKSPMMSVEVR